MINVSDTAKARIEVRRADALDHRWYLTVSWRKGSADNSRASDGSAVWMREPDYGWGVHLTHWSRWPEGAPDLGEPLWPGVRLFISNSGDHLFPGGHVTVENGELRLIVHAV